LLAEFAFVKHAFALPFKRAAFATFVANAVSTVLGVLLIPLSGIAWEYFPGAIYMKAFGWGTFNPVTWAATFFLACIVNTVLEAQVYKRGFKLRVGRREYIWVFAANAVSVGAAFVSLLVDPYRP
jgi:hypothetical protein